MGNKLLSTYSLLAALLLVIGVPTFLISLSVKLKSFAVKVIEVVLGLVRLTEVGTPTANTDAANKEYVDDG